MIKPEDVTDKLAIGLFHNVAGVTLDACRYNVAAIINAAIEAGVVSPPCYQPVVDGEPLNDVFGPTIFATQQSVEEWFVDREMCRESWGGRHWKGQAE
jgi:hypothetical protein